MIKWQYTKKMRNNKGILETRTLNTSFNPLDVSIEFREYSVEYLKENINTNKNKALAINNGLKRLWVYLGKYKFINFYDFFENIEQWELTFRDTSKSSARKSKEQMLAFCEFCHQKNNTFAPSKYGYLNMTKSKVEQSDVVVYMDNNADKVTVVFDFVPEELKALYLKYLEYRKTRGYLAGTVYGEFRTLKHLINFMQQYKINQIDDFDMDSAMDFINYIKTLKNEFNNNKPLSPRMQQYIFYSNRSFVRFLAVYETKYEMAASCLNEFNIRRDEAIKTVSIHETAIRQFKKHAKTTENIYLKPAIMLLYTYGLRRSEILNLKHNCLQINQDDKERYDLHYYVKKSDKNRVVYKIDVALVLPLKILIESTKELRKASDLDYIYITKKISTIISGKIDKIDTKTLGRWINGFVIENKITNPDGTLAKATPHMFRRTIPELYEKKGVSLQTTQSVLGHKNISTTDKYYNRTNEYEYEKTISKAINNIVVQKDTIRLSGNTGLYNIIEEGYCGSSDAYSSDGICEYIKTRGNCYGCPNMVTTPKYIPFFREQVAIWCREKDKLAHLGSHVTRHFDWKISVVNGIISKLEGLENE